MTEKLKSMGGLLMRAVGFSLTTVALVLIILRYWPDDLQHRAVVGSLAAAAMVAIFLELVTRRRLDTHHEEMKRLFEAHSVREDSWNGVISGITGRLANIDGKLVDLSKVQNHDHAHLEEVRAVLRIKGWLPSIRGDEE